MGARLWMTAIHLPLVHHMRVTSYSAQWSKQYHSVFWYSGAWWGEREGDNLVLWPWGLGPFRHGETEECKQELPDVTKHELRPGSNYVRLLNEIKNQTLAEEHFPYPSFLLPTAVCSGIKTDVAGVCVCLLLTHSTIFAHKDITAHTSYVSWQQRNEKMTQLQGKDILRWKAEGDLETWCGERARSRGDEVT